ncbi:Piso0_005325 [Millerozyma farinosa CBS 7064]|uniref:Piso0_005325 protein n=1 Tax=Pichia sorbitophila (strain ATCC MYA-4447 / BCRC 22081 / CBS 7064 / NBRC 10061 / NRRL Y-12695) TaxID=559304 RepID=G8Y1V9_PICSO|nr:Piso0_005325 [Millerozyma farinosa CBS 7064]
MAKEDIMSILKSGGKVSKHIEQGSKLSLNGVQKLSESISNPNIAFHSGWKLSGTHLLFNRPPKERYSKLLQEKCDERSVKIAGFDLDDTLVKTKSGSKMPRGAYDWTWWRPKGSSDSKVLSKLLETHQKKFIIVIFTNQGGIIAQPTSKSYQNFINRVNDIESKIKSYVKDEELEIQVFAAPKRPAKPDKNIRSSSDELHKKARKPSVGMWDELERVISEYGYTCDRKNSIFIGDAAGREGDFSDSDKEFARNIGITFYTPEEYFS